MTGGRARAHNRFLEVLMTKLVFTDPGGNQVGTSRDGRNITMGDAKHHGHVDGDSIVFPAGVLIGRIRGRNVIDPSGKLLLLIQEKG